MVHMEKLFCCVRLRAAQSESTACVRMRAHARTRMAACRLMCGYTYASLYVPSYVSMSIFVSICAFLCVFLRVSVRNCHINFPNAQIRTDTHTHV